MSQTLPDRTKKTNFSDLPFEIRQKIWQCLPHRKLNIREGAMEESALRRLGPSNRVFINHRFATPGAALPVGLHVNYESRTETLKHYTVLHRPVVHNGKILSSYKALFLINTDYDTPFMTEFALLKCEPWQFTNWIAGMFAYYGAETKKVRDAIEKIEIYILPIEAGPGYVFANIRELLRFRGLKEIVLDQIAEPEWYIAKYQEELKIGQDEKMAKYGHRELPQVTVRLDTCVEEFM
ncbi:hypothetical protein ACMFMG_008215 [Clarireedia jacksonii]